MFHTNIEMSREGVQTTPAADPVLSNSLFWAEKRALDIIGGLTLLMFVLAWAGLLLLLNPIWNRGPVFFSQKRMGRDCKPFHAIKFRTMRGVNAISRGADDPIETDRITPLGRVMRQFRIDELPQIFNVLVGQMSFIGPRPDCYEHALVFLEKVPGYRARHVVRPGISGLAQVSLGYIEGIEATKAKVRADLHYIAHASFIMDLSLAIRTIAVILRRAGA